MRLGEKETETETIYGEEAETRGRECKQTKGEIERQAAAWGSAGDKAGPGCRTPHLGRGSDTVCVLVRGPCSVNQEREERSGRGV